MLPRAWRLLAFIAATHLPAVLSNLGASPEVRTRKFGGVTWDSNRTATASAENANELGDAASSLERSRRFQAEQIELRQPDADDDAQPIAEPSGLRATAKRLMFGTKLLIADLMLWRRLRTLPEEALTYDEVTPQRGGLKRQSGAVTLTCVPG